MKSVMAAEDRKERRAVLDLRFLALAVALCVVGLIAGGCNWRQPGEPSAEVKLKHQRTLRLNTEMMTSDLDRALMLDRPSRLTDKRLP